MWNKLKIWWIKLWTQANPDMIEQQRREYERLAREDSE